MTRLTLGMALGLLASTAVAAQSSPTDDPKAVSAVPYSGWSSFSQQTIAPDFFTQANMQAQSDALLASGLQAHGYNYLNLDSGWQGTYDGYGRPIPNLATFPDIKGLFDHIHANGQKAGIYWIPGVQQPAIDANAPILGTPYHIRDILAEPYRAGNSFGGPGTSPYHYKIDFSKPGAQEYIDSVVALFASWGADFIKLDAVTPGSYSDDLRIDNRDDVAAWSKAIAKSGRPIWFTVSWQLNKDYLDVWRQYSNARRIDDDVECQQRCATMTNWPRIYKRLRNLPGWQDTAGPLTGWNDLDSLEIVNGASDGLNIEEKKTAFSIWAMANSPLYLGGDLTKLTDQDRRIVTNDDVLALARSTKPGRERLGGDHPVWVSDQGGGIYYVAIFNTNNTPENVSFNWRDIGLSGAAVTKDVWSGAYAGVSFGTYSTRVEGHGVRMLKIWALPGSPYLPALGTYEAESAALGGSAVRANCPTCSGGMKVGGLSLGAANTLTFQNVRAPRTGTYLMQLDSMTMAMRSFQYRINNGPVRTFNAGGGSFSSPTPNRLPVCLKAGANSIQFSNPSSYGPDIDRIAIFGDGSSRLPSATTYEAEAAELGAGVTTGFSNYASGLAKAGNIGGAGRTVTFSSVDVPTTGDYQLEIDYMTSGPRTFAVSVNGAAPRSFTVTGSSFDDPASAMYKVSLKAGRNVIRVGNETGYAPDLDRLVIAPWLGDRAGNAPPTQTCG